MTLPIALLVIAVICFVLDGFSADTNLNLFSLGWAFVIASFIVGRVPVI